MKKHLVMCASMLALALLSSVAIRAADPETVLRYAELNPAAHPMAQGAMEFARLVKEKSGGRIDVQVYDSGQLGDEKSMYQALQMGAVDFFRGNVMNLGDFGVESFSVIGLPYMFRNLDHLGKVLRSDVGKSLLDDVQKSGSGMIGLAYMEEGPRNMFFSKKEVRTLKDVKGLKIRVPETQLMMDTISALGANPTPLAYSELYTSIQTGVVDGAENGITGYVTNSFFEVAPIYVKDAHTFGAGITLMSESSWNKLSPDDQRILRESAMQAMDFVLDITNRIEAKYYEDMAAKGIKIIEVEDLPAWSAAVADLHKRYGAEYADVIKKIKAQ